MIDPCWAGARRVLAVRLDNLGDVLVTTPAIRALREGLPGAHLALLASGVGAQVGRLNPDLDEVIVHEAPWVDPWARLPHDPAREQALIARLTAGRFDAAVIFTSFRQSPLPAAYACYLAGIPLRLAASVDGPGSLLTMRHRHVEGPVHEVERGLGLVGAVGFGTERTGLVLEVPEGAREWARGWVDDGRPPPAPQRWGELRCPASGADAPPTIGGPGGAVGRSSRPLVVLHPGCTMPARTYPWERYAEVARLLVERLGATVVVTGAAGERDLVERVVAAVPPPARSNVRPCAGELDFPAFCGLVELADLTVTNNTGPMHVSAALGTPVVALFALTNPPEQWGPWRVPHRLLNVDVPCRLCYARACPHGQECLTLVPPERVVEAAADLMADAGWRMLDVGDALTPVLPASSIQYPASVPAGRL